MITIYALIDPRDNVVRYVGITNNIYERFKQHIRCDGTNARKDAWIRDLRDQQFMVYMHALERVETYEQALDREMFWIRHYLSQGILLTNISGVPVSKLPKPKTVAERSQRPVTSPIPEGFVRYSTDRFLKRLYFYTSTGHLVTFEKADNEDFDEYIRRYAQLSDEKHPDDDPRILAEFWHPEGNAGFWYAGGIRCQILNHLRIEGGILEIYDIHGNRLTEMIGNPLKGERLKQNPA